MCLHILVCYAYCMAIDVVLGLQRGDEGKGRFVDLLTADYDVVARFNGGPNAGHTIARKGAEPLKLHQIPSGITYAGVVNVIGNGSYVDPVKLLDEIDDLRRAGVEVSADNLLVSADAHMILPHHVRLDKAREAGRSAQGSTGSGIAYVARDKYERTGIRVEALLEDESFLRGAVAGRLGTDADSAKTAREWTEKAAKLKPFVADSFRIIQDCLKSGKKVLAEGAQATWLDIEHGMYPFVTSSHTTTGGMLNGLGVGPKHIGKIVGVAKVLRSHVGGGPFVTREDDPEKAARIRGEKGGVDSEYGATTARERQVGYLDLPELRRAIAVNGVTELALTKLDLVPRAGKELPVAVEYEYKGTRLDFAPTSAQILEQCKPVYEYLPAWQEDVSTTRKYEDLSVAAKTFISFLEKKLGVPITMMGVGPYRDQVIVK